MSTDQQSATNRETTQKSTGPVRPEGKEHRKFNAQRQGLTGNQTVVMPNEDMEAFNLMKAAIVESFECVGPVETQLAQSYAGFQWRINRAAALEENLITMGLMINDAGNFNIENIQAHNAINNVTTFRNDVKMFDKLSLYSNRLMNQAAKVLGEMKWLQDRRKKRETAEMQEAIRIYQHHRKDGVAFDPKAHGFVLTVDRIQAQINRELIRTEDYIAALTKKAA